MDRAILEGHQATLRGLRDTIGGMQQRMTKEFDSKDSAILLGLIEPLAAAVGDMIDDAIRFADHLADMKRQFEAQAGPSAHAKAVAAELAPSHRPVTPADPRD